MRKLIIAGGLAAGIGIAVPAGFAAADVPIYSVTEERGDQSCDVTLWYIEHTGEIYTTEECLRILIS